MSQQSIHITHLFNAPVEEVFHHLTDHETFGEVINTPIKRVVDSHDPDKNGIGSVRRITAFPFPAFEETVVAFEANQFMEYAVSKGGPIKNHKGRMEFSDEQGKTRLNYTIHFEPKLPLPFWGAVLKRAIETPIDTGLKKLVLGYETGK